MLSSRELSASYTEQGTVSESYALVELINRVKYSVTTSIVFDPIVEAWHPWLLKEKQINFNCEAGLVRIKSTTSSNPWGTSVGRPRLGDFGDVRFVAMYPGASFQLFLGGQTIFFIFQCHRTVEKLEKQHFICSNLTLFIVPFFLSFFFIVFLFFCFSFFFLFFFFLGGGGRRSPSPLK